ncbi:MAG: hypothetical protein JNM36_06445 [Chitinophagales bacterium]|jgi:hypothetical protein|nr:hypothetical protein [Chitinophagales bacterium]HNI45781.1 hypothetical protein [Chitinophagales bacterium]
METYEIIVRLHKDQDINNLLQDMQEHRLIVQRKVAVNLNIWLLSCNDYSAINDNVLNLLKQHPAVQMVQQNHSTILRRPSLLP